MVLFAEGTRSADGRLQQYVFCFSCNLVLLWSNSSVCNSAYLYRYRFKKGAFQIAKAAGVKIVPVSIGNLHRLMPKQAVLPIAPLQHAYIKIHPAIETANRTISEVRSLCHQVSYLCC